MVPPGWKTNLRMVAYTRVSCVRLCACASLIDRIDSLLYVCGDMLTVQEKVLFHHAGGEWVFFWAVRVTGAISNRERRRATNVIDGKCLGFRVSGLGFRV